MEGIRFVPGLKARGRFLLSLAAVGVIGLAGTVASPQADAQASPVTARTAAAPAVLPAADDGRRVPAGFTEQKTKVGDVAINYVRGGHGKTLVLLHGYPQTWYTWREVLPELAKHYTVIAPDLRGAGKSDAPAGGYDKKTLAADVYGLLSKLGLQHDIRLVGHDIGTMVSYAYAAAHPGDVTKLVLSEAPIPDKSLYTFSSLTPKGPGFWNFGFFSVTNGLPERMVNGKEELWVERFTDMLEVQKDGVDNKQVREYARFLRDDAHLRASFEWFRAFPKDVADNAEYVKKKLRMPVLAIGAAGSLGDFVPTQVRKYATNVTGVVIANSGHWIFEEQPAELTRRVLTFLK
ncbi:alpha/beta fold hydrolase [Streptosporangium lutulentum]|uniref:Pimeloyl-ACP methyl ester carboxylesterase n=1 Tax=Streptosporangium lutulentum TaxID=1461250 RepID=A0ABT9QPC2_9ACTN|nr:alpha/beta hydrolase [Streptosporangium lutulentum]MDP9848596.1 pimeloyl-ACP methyl ester carboxylesterase [Streptosporangium lutulentum]